jgi:hypothetical protein
VDTHRVFKFQEEEDSGRLLSRRQVKGLSLEALIALEASYTKLQ